MDVPQEKELALSLQRVTQSYLPPPFYGPVRPERLRCQTGHQHARMIQGVRPNPLHLGSATALSLTAMAQEEGKAEGLNLVPVLIPICPTTMPA